MSNGTTIANQIGARLSLRKPQSESLAILCRLLEQLKLEKEPDLQHWIENPHDSFHTTALDSTPHKASLSMRGLFVMRLWSISGKVAHRARD